MAKTDISQAKAHDELIELVSGRDAHNFTLSVICSEGQVSVSVKDLDSGAHAIGEGADFREAWFNQKPAWTR